VRAERAPVGKSVSLQVEPRPHDARDPRHAVGDRVRRARRVGSAELGAGSAELGAPRGRSRVRTSPGRADARDAQRGIECAQNAP
jgi:hypothetical protein